MMITSCKRHDLTKPSDYKPYKDYRRDHAEAIIAGQTTDHSMKGQGKVFGILLISQPEARLMIMMGRTIVE